jgi:trigger factor
MKVSTEPIGNSQLLLNIEMETSEVDRYLDRAYQRLAKRVSVPGFRKGRVPKEVLVSYVGKEALFREALEDLIPEAYAEAVESHDIEPIAQPSFEIVQTEPLVFKAVVPLKPTVKLGDYSQVKIEAEPVEVNDAEIDAVLEQLRQEHAVLSPVERPVAFGDEVTMDVEEIKEGRPIPLRQDLLYEVREGSRLPLPGFAEKLVGMVRDEERDILLSYPEDYDVAELAGRQHIFRVKVKDIKEKKLPDLDDEFARVIGSEDLAPLRRRIADVIKARKESMARVEAEKKIMDALVEISQVEYPPVLVEREIDRLVADEARHFAEGVAGLERYLKVLGKTMAEHREELRAEAVQRVVRSLVLDEVVEAEKVEVSDSEVDEEVDRMAASAGDRAESVREAFRSEDRRESVRWFLKRRKAMDRLVERLVVKPG